VFIQICLRAGLVCSFSSPCGQILRNFTLVVITWHIYLLFMFFRARSTAGFHLVKWNDVVGLQSWSAWNKKHFCRILVKLQEFVPRLLLCPKIKFSKKCLSCKKYKRSLKHNIDIGVYKWCLKRNKEHFRPYKGFIAICAVWMTVVIRVLRQLFSSKLLHTGQLKTNGSFAWRGKEKSNITRSFHERILCGLRWI
jgi:hypothetical protein